MICESIIMSLEKENPLSYAESWDNTGLQIGSRKTDVGTIYIALDPTKDVIEDAIIKGADMLITHHPLIFSPIKKITSDHFIGERVIQLIQHHISYYVMHTNYDICNMAELSGDILKLKNHKVLDTTSRDQTGSEKGVGRIGYLPEVMSLADCALYVKKQFSIPNVKVFGSLDTKVERAAISPGSGKDYIQPSLNGAADVLITGDIGHHDGIDAIARGLAIIDAGHYGLEHIFTRDVKNMLEQNTSGVKILTAPTAHPFQII